MNSTFDTPFNIGQITSKDFIFCSQCVASGNESVGYMWGLIKKRLTLFIFYLIFSDEYLLQKNENNMSRSFRYVTRVLSKYISSFLWKKEKKRVYKKYGCFAFIWLKTTRANKKQSVFFAFIEEVKQKYYLATVLKS